MAASAAVKRLRRLANQIPDDAVVWDALQVLVDHDSKWADHAIALLGASYIEKALEVAIKSRLIALTKTEEDGLFSYEKSEPLSDLSSRIKIAYALDIVSRRTREDLEHVRVVRNAFAHALTPIGFEFEQVSDVCKLLFTHDNLGLLSRWAVGESPRARYINTVLSIGTRLKDKLKVAQRDVMIMHAGRAFPVRFLP